MLFAFVFLLVQEKFHKQVYGISISSSKSNFASAIIENPEMLKIHQRHVMKQQTLANINKPAAPPPPLIPCGTPTKQDAVINGMLIRLIIIFIIIVVIIIIIIGIPHSLKKKKTFVTGSSTETETNVDLLEITFKIKLLRKNRKKHFNLSLIILRHPPLSTA